MCIAIVKPLGKTISKDTLKACAKNNPDGMGFAYIKDGTLYINKYLNDFDRFYKDYSELETTSPMLIHFRIATHGEVNLDNCHPFILNDKMALVHNGVITGYGDKKTKSDTVDFIEKVIGNIGWKNWKNPAFRELVGKAIGYSKLAILDENGNYYIINESKGNWNDGVWYSNESYKVREVVKATTTQLVLPTKTDKKEDEFECTVVYRCKCGEEFDDTGYKWSRKCPKCGSYDVVDVGWKEDGRKYYYDQQYYDYDHYDYDQSWYGMNEDLTTCKK